jgi:hypothetical protein
MVRTLDKSNSFRRLKIAYIYSSEEFRQQILEYICNSNNEGNFSEIIVSSKWKAFALKNESIVNDITAAVFEKKKWFK